MGGRDSGCPRTGPAAFPYMGDFSLTSWNAQALMATEPRRRKAKWGHCLHLLGRSDVMVLQETHSTRANTARLILPHSHRFWWSHGTQQTAGIAIGVATTLLNKFGQPTMGRPGEWTDIVAGRAAMLRLEGPQGAFDLIVVYLHTGKARKDRDRIRRAIYPHLRKPAEALTVIVGDWNFVTMKTDRMGLEDAGWTDAQDAE